MFDSQGTNHKAQGTLLRNRIALITGASRGIGQAVALRYAKEGAHCILVARSKRGLEETDDQIRSAGGSATLIQLDLLQFPKIDELAQLVAQRFGKLDILVGNAAILGDISPMAHQSPETWRQTIDLNLNANFHLIRCFDPLLKQSDAPRALFVTSGVTSSPHAYWGAYSVSKMALENMVLLYAAENAKTALRVNLINPGPVRTRMRAQAMPGEDPETLVKPEEITDLFVSLALGSNTQTGGQFHVDD